MTRWLKNESDDVDADEPLLEASTDKVDTEVPSPVTGRVLSIKVKEDQTVEVGVELALIGEPSEVAAGAEASQNAPDTATDTAPGVTAPTVGSEAAGAFLTPLVRRLASEHGVDLSVIRGSGAGGRIRKSDVLAPAVPFTATPEALAAASATSVPTSAPSTPPTPSEPAAAQVAATAAEPVPAVASEVAAGRAAAGRQAVPSNAAPPGVVVQRGRVVPMSRMHQVIARLVESLQTSAQLTTLVEVDVTKIARLRQQVKRDFEHCEGVKLTFLPFFVLAALEALKAHPVLNASVDMETKTITNHGVEHLGIAVDTDRGLLVPVIHNAGELNLGGIARKIADLAERVRAQRISPEDVGGGTFTLTSTGSRGALFDTPIINQPQVGILGTGTVVKRRVVVNDEEFGETIAVRSMVYLALSYDHRVVDGADAARFLATMKQRLEKGAF